MAQQLLPASNDNLIGREKSPVTNFSIIRVYRSFNDAFRWITENN